jgi:hypothetical protein
MSPETRSPALGNVTRVADPSVRKSIDVELMLVAQSDTLINDRELTIVQRPNATMPTRSTVCDRCRALARSWP